MKRQIQAQVHSITHCISIQFRSSPWTAKGLIGAVNFQDVRRKIRDSVEARTPSRSSIAKHVCIVCLVNRYNRGIDDVVTLSDPELSVLDRAVRDERLLRRFATWNRAKERQRFLKRQDARFFSV